MSNRSLIAAAATLAVGLAGCGASSSTSTAGSTSSAAGSTSAPATSTSTPSTTTGTSPAGSSGGSFKSAFAAEKAKFSRIGTDLGQAVVQAPSRSNRQIAAEFGLLAARTSRQAASLRQLHPPASLSAEVGQLAAGFDKVAADMRAIVAAATSGNGSQARAAGMKIAQDSARVKAVDRDLTAKLGLPQTP